MDHPDLCQSDLMNFSENGAHTPVSGVDEQWPVEKPRMHSERSFAHIVGDSVINSREGIKKSRW
jgi:hypothetical protein